MSEIQGEGMKLSLNIVAWAVLTGVGAAGIFNTLLVVASGMGRLNLGNALPAIAGSLLLGIGVRKLLFPGVPLFSNPMIYLVFKGILSLVALWIIVVLLFIAYAWPAAGSASAQWMVVLGAGLRGDQLSLTLMARLDAAAAYWRQHPEIKIVVSGGQGPHELISEAEAMYLYLEQAGVPRAQLYQENRSTSTWENIAFSKAVIAKAGHDPSKPLVIVSNRYHLFRAVRIARAQSIEAVGVPAATPGSVFLGSYMREILAVTKFMIYKQ